VRKTDLSVARQRCLVRAHGHPNCWALVPPETPRRLDLNPLSNEALQKAHQALGALQAATAHLPNVDLITRTLSRREAVQSSGIEGTRTDLPGLLEYEATRGAEGGTADARVVESYVTSLDVGLRAVQAEGRGGLTVKLVKALHAELMAGERAELLPGQFRDGQVWIGSDVIEGARFVPAPPDAVPPLMDELASSMLRYTPGEDEQASISIILQLALAHAQFETIHPFFDGNGRVGRLLMPLMLAAEKHPPLYLSGYLLRYRQAYYDALAGVQLREDWDGWVGFLCRAVVQSAEASLAIARDLNAIHDGWMGELRDLRSDSTARRLPRLLLGMPVISVKQAAEALETSFPAANEALKVLVERGILDAPTRRRNRVFRAPRILERLAAP
jgi:Fic family protein